MKAPQNLNSAYLFLVPSSATGSEAHPFAPVPVLVNSEGKAVWSPPTHILVRCNMDLSNWPRDEHECMVRLGSWAHHGEQIDIQVQADQHAGVTERLLFIV